MKNQKIIDKFLSNVWLFENVFWKSTDLIIYDNDKEKMKRFLYQLYGKKDTFDLFPAELDNDRMNTTLKTLFTYYDVPDDRTKK